MSLNETHARIKSRVWKEIAQAKIDISKLDKETVEAIVDLATEAALLEMDDTLTQTIATGKAAPEAVPGMPDQSVFDDQKEDILWEGRPFLSLVMEYTITDERIRITEGLLGKARENVELVRIQDMDYSQTFGERIMNIGDITIRSHDPSHPNIILRNVQNPESVYEILRRAVLNARKKHGFTYREEM
ncbi:MAG: PH domain-containing protein [Ardenticatenaceae bacterium]|nr:PH domain-containing protein [Ardenticatenaceae bacterium]